MSFVFIWRIENASFSTLKNGEYLESPTFKADILNNTKWFLKLFLRGDKDENNISCYLQRYSADLGHKTITLDYELSYILADTTCHSSQLIKNCTFKYYKNRGTNQFMSRDDFREKIVISSNDLLVIRCRMWRTKLAKNQQCVSTLCKGRTRIDVEHTSFDWPIKNFPSLHTNEKHLKEIPFVSMPALALGLEMHLEGGSNMKKLMRFQLSLEKNSQPIYLNCRIAVLDAEKDVAMCKQHEYLYDLSDAKQVWAFPFSFSRNELISAKNNYLLDNTLYLQCEFKLSSGVQSSSIEATHSRHSGTISFDNYNTAPNNLQGNSSSLQCNLFNLYTGGSDHDITFRLHNGQELKAHKCILSARSSYFATMFKCDMKENNTNIIKVLDFSVHTMDQLLKFIYSGIIEDLQWRNVLELYKAGHKYMMQSLVSECALFLKTNISTSNIYDLYTLADRYGATEIEKVVLDFFCTNFKEIKFSEEWNEFSQNHKGLLSAVLNHQKGQKLYFDN